MMETHPAELDLFSYVEGDLDEPEARAVADHVAFCTACRGTIRELEAGRDALRDSPLLHLPPRRRDAILGGLPQREPRRGGFGSTKRALAIATPIAAAAAVVIALANVNGNGSFEGAQGGGGEEAARTGAAAEAGSDAAGGETADEGTAPASKPQSKSQTMRNAFPLVGESPESVARFLRRKGYDARVVDGKVRVRTDDPEGLRRLLATLPHGNVQILVE